MTSIETVGALILKILKLVSEPYFCCKTPQFVNCTIYQSYLRYGALVLCVEIGRDRRVGVAFGGGDFRSAFKAMV
jgi:hypothetical protein